MTSNFLRKSTRLVAILSIAGLVAGCATVGSTTAYYLPTTDEKFPPKPRSYVMPVLSGPPDRPYQTIGTFDFVSSRGFPFIRAAIEYNARIHGADAVILHSVNGRRELVIGRVPPRVTYVPGGPFYGGYGFGYRPGWGPGWRFGGWYPLFQPGYTFADQEIITSVDAEMIIFL